jgi:hypothetical protein
MREVGQRWRDADFQPLSESVGVAFFRHVLGDGKGLSKALLEVFRFQDARYLSTLPPGVDPGISVADMRRGGRFSAINEGLDPRGREIPGFGRYAGAGWMAWDYLAKEDAVVVFEDELLSMSWTQENTAGWPKSAHWLGCGEDVYQALWHEERDMRRLVDSFRHANAWMSVCALTVDSEGPPSDLSLEGIDGDRVRAWAEAAQAIILGAYDGEGHAVCCTPELAERWLRSVEHT